MEENNNYQVVPQPVEGEGSIDYIALLKRLWQKRKLIMVIVGAFAVIGLAAALLQKPVYKASCTFVPQMSGKKGNSTLSSLAALAGMSSMDLGASSELSPLIYPQLLDNVDLMKELIYTKFDFKKFDEPVSLFDYYMNPDYQQTSWVGYYLAYSYGLPLTLLGYALEAVLPQPTDEPVASASVQQTTPEVSRYTKDEYECVKFMHTCISLNVEKKDGYLTLSCQMKEKQLAAEVCQAVFDLLGKYITEFKLAKASDDNVYIRSLYEEAKADYEQKQLALARFEDSNRGAMTATAQIRRDQLLADYNLAYAMYTELSKQLLQSDMQVKEDTPILSAVKPVVVPNMKSNSRAKTLAVFVFLGVCVACGLVLGLELQYSFRSHVFLRLQEHS